MTVRAKMGVALELAKVPEAEIDEKVQEAARRILHRPTRAEQDEPSAPE